MTVPIRDAATVILVRDALDEDGEPAIEVCMLRRALDAEFVAGAYVFPGGSVDPDDRGADVEGLCRGRTDGEASAVLGVESGGLAFWVAALRECFEEAGVLLAYPSDHRHGARDGSAIPLLDTSDPVTTARFAGYRDAVNAGTTGILDVCRSEGLALAVDSVHYVSHWITPELAPKRYDTRFFIAAAPPGQVARHDDSETIASIWVRPADAMARHQAGEIDLLQPTVTNLANIVGFHSTSEVMAWAAAITDVVTVLPVVVLEDGRLLILRPGDIGYEEALEAKQASDAAGKHEVEEAARAAWGPGAVQA